MDGVVQMLEVAPYLVVSDVMASARFYRDTLGFETDQVEGEPPTFALLSRDGIALMLRAAPPGVERMPSAGTGRADVYIWVTDVVALAAELFGRGAEVMPIPSDPPVHDGREMQVRDPDGNVICFGQLLD